MVKKEGEHFVCEDCDMKYKEKEWAEKCEKFCRDNKACDVEIMKHAIK